MGISLPRPVSNTDSRLIPHRLCSQSYAGNLGRADSLIPSPEQRSPFADCTVSPRGISVSRGVSVSAIGYNTSFNTNSPATPFQVCRFFMFPQTTIGTQLKKRLSVCVWSLVRSLLSRQRSGPCAPFPRCRRRALGSRPDRRSPCSAQWCTSCRLPATGHRHNTP